MPVLIDRYRPVVRTASRYRSISTGICITFVIYIFKKQSQKCFGVPDPIFGFEAPKQGRIGPPWKQKIGVW
jgi:hypothetical protein